MPQEAPDRAWPTFCLGTVGMWVSACSPGQGPGPVEGKTPSLRLPGRPRPTPRPLTHCQPVSRQGGALALSSLLPSSPSLTPSSRPAGTQSAWPGTEETTAPSWPPSLLEAVGPLLLPQRVPLLTAHSRLAPPCSRGSALSPGGCLRVPQPSAGSRGSAFKGPVPSSGGPTSVAPSWRWPGERGCSTGQCMDTEAQTPQLLCACPVPFCESPGTS